MQPHQPGPCYGNFARWFYNHESGGCQQFIYGGCMGNENRFNSEAECLDRCQDPPAVGKYCLKGVNSLAFGKSDWNLNIHFFKK